MPRFFLSLTIIFFTLPSLASDIDLRYRLQWGNFAMGDVFASWQLRPTGYQMQGGAISAGTVGWLMRYQGEVRLEGQLAGDRVLPDSLFLSSDSRRGARQARTLWPGASRQPVTSRLPELNLEKVIPLDETALAGINDPFSTMLGVLRQMQQGASCSGQFEIYDGWRHARLTLYDLGETELVADRPWSYSGAARICGIASQPLGGQSRKSSWSEEDLDPQRIRFFVADLEAGLPLPVRIELRGFLGRVTVRLDMERSRL
jgi:hypothetical protein